MEEEASVLVCCIKTNQNRTPSFSLSLFFFSFGLIDRSAVVGRLVIPPFCFHARGAKCELPIIGCPPPLQKITLTWVGLVDGSIRNTVVAQTQVHTYHQTRSKRKALRQSINLSLHNKRRIAHKQGGGCEEKPKTSTPSPPSLAS